MGQAGIGHHSASSEVTGQERPPEVAGGPVVFQSLWSIGASLQMDF